LARLLLALQKKRKALGCLFEPKIFGQKF
jgi:hypothetical protein